MDCAVKATSEFVDIHCAYEKLMIFPRFISALDTTSENAEVI